MKVFTKTMTPVLLFSVSSFFFFLPKADAQPAWQPIHLTVSGHNTLNGVHASFQLNTCNGEDVVFVKLVNTNNYAVTIEWYPAVFTKELIWIKKETPADKKSVSLNPNAELAGDCSAANLSMMIRLKDFPVDVINFKLYGTSNFAVYTN